MWWLRMLEYAETFFILYVALIANVKFQNNEFLEFATRGHDLDKKAQLLLRATYF